jgi:prepilin-type N-terminal cleavage/methylation domain-containing protein
MNIKSSLIKITKPVYRERGFSLIEVLIGITLMGILGSAFLAAVSTSTNTLTLTAMQDKAKQLAESQIEYTKHQPFSSTNKVNAPTGYQIDIQFPVIPGRPDGNIQAILVTVSYKGSELIQLEDFEVK